MKNILISVILIFFSTVITAQNKTTTALKALSDAKQYDKIIEHYSSNFKEYSSKSLYYIGFAYYMKEDDSNCIKFMNLSLDKNSKDSELYYIKASTLNYMKEYQEAILNFKSAIDLKSDNGEFYSGLGDSYC